MCVTEGMFAAEDTIFAQFESERLRECLETCAARLEKQIFWGRPGCPGLLAVPAFVVLIDRGAVGSLTFDHYLQMVKECNSPAEGQMGDEDVRVHQTCIIVDDHDDRDVPKVPAVLHLNQLNPCLEQWMQRTLELAASTYMRGSVTPQVSPTPCSKRRRSE